MAVFLTVHLCITSSHFILGFPAWAFYALIMTILYSFIIVIILQIYWPTKKQRDEL